MEKYKVTLYHERMAVSLFSDARPKQFLISDSDSKRQNFTQFTCANFTDTEFSFFRGFCLVWNYARFGKYVRKTNGYETACWVDIRKR